MTTNLGRVTGERDLQRHPGTAGRGGLLAAAALTIGLICHQGEATVSQWTGNANQNWSAATWSAGMPDGAGDIADLTYDITAARILTIDTTNRTVGILNIGDSGSAYFGYTLAASGGAQLVLTNTGARAQLNQTDTSVNNTISAPLALADSVDIANASTNLLTLSGTITNVAQGAVTLSNVGQGAGGVTISGPIVNGAGIVGVEQKSATSPLTLSGANNFAGGLTIRAGTVIGITSAFAFGTNTSVVTLGDSSGSLDATLVGGVAGTFANPISVAAGNSGAATLSNTAASIFSRAITLNSHDLILSPAASALTLNGGIQGTGNLTLNATGAGAITFLTNSVNPVGAITNSGAGVGVATLGGGVGSNVTAITENSTNSALTISTTNLVVNGGGTTLANINAGGVRVLTVSGGVVGTGNLILNNHSAITNGITLSTLPVNHSGMLVNSGLGSGPLSISAVIGANVGPVIQASTSSVLALSGANTFSNGLTVKAGTVSGTTSSNAFGANTNVITLGDSGGSLEATLVGGFAGTFPQRISVAAGNSGSVTLSNTAASVFSGAVTLNAHDLLLASSASLLTLSGGIAGTGQLTLRAGAGGITLSTVPVNPAGTITNAGAGAGTVTLSGGVGSNVTAITENSASSALTLSTLTVNAAGTTLANNNAGGLAGFSVSGGVTGTGSLTLANNSAITNGLTLSGATVNPAGSITNSGTGSGDVLISATIGTNVSGVVQQSATSRLVLSGSNTYGSGTVIATNSTVWVANTNGSATGTGAVNVNGTLQGNGTVSGTVTLQAGGTLAPGLDGAAGGTLTVGALTWNGGGVYRCKVADLAHNGAGAGVDYDQVVVSGTLDAAPAGSNLVIRLDSLGRSLAFETNRNYSLRIITYGTAPGFNPVDVTLDTNAFLAGGTWTVTNLGRSVWVTCLGATSTNRNYWTGAGNWSGDTNWSMGHAPLPDEEVEFDFRNVSDCTVDAVSNAVGSITLAAGYTGTVTVLTKFPAGGSFTQLTVTGDFVIHDGTVTHAANSGDTLEYDRLAISVGGNLVVGPYGAIKADQKGFNAVRGTSPGGNATSSTGAGHGGQASFGTGLAAPGPTYGSVYYPTNLGSGANGRGGGAILLDVAGAATIDGAITAAGQGGSRAGAAGGSILLKAASLSGAGVLGAPGGSGVSPGGAGGGGRIAVILTGGASFGDVSFRAYGAGGAICPSAAGTVYLQKGGQVEGEGTLLVDNNNLTPFNPLGVCTLLTACDLNQLESLVIRNRGILGVNTNTALDFGLVPIQGAGASVVTNWRTAAAGPAAAAIALRATDRVTFPDPFVISNYSLCLDVPVSVTGNWVVADNGSLSHSGNYNPTPGAEDYRLRLALVGNLTVEAGGAIEVNTKGYFGEKGPAPGLQGQSVRGASHGGRGGTAVNGANTNASLNGYGSVTAPTTLGSGGGRYLSSDWPPRPGAGSIELTVQGTTTVQGVISARPSQPAISRWAGAAGGSISLRTRWLDGAGAVDARADVSGSDNNGSGGGGRIAVILTDSESFGNVTMSAAGNASGWASAAGTLYRERASERGGRGTLLIDNANITGSGNRTVTQLPAPAYAPDNELRGVTLIVSNRAQVVLTTNVAMRDLFLYTNSVLYLKGYTLQLGAVYHTNWGKTNWVVYESGQILWSAPGTLLLLR